MLEPHGSTKQACVVSSFVGFFSSIRLDCEVRKLVIFGVTGLQRSKKRKQVFNRFSGFSACCALLFRFA